MLYEAIGVVGIAIVITLCLWAAVMGAAEKTLNQRRQQEYHEAANRAE